ncbi:MAG: DegQ family serine endoprotease [Proteobacteria bacterium]|nr:DegQ family serine endoprotease [Pseudomonadota bacterium]
MPAHVTGRTPRVAGAARAAAGWWLGRAFALLFLAAAAAQPALARTPPEGFADIVEKLLPAVVNISTTQVVSAQKGPEIPSFPPGSPFEEFFKDFFERNQPQERRQRRATSLGSGFVIDPSGLVVTNNHVIDEADEIEVIFHDNSKRKAKLLGRDAKTDLALLKVEADKPLAFVQFGDSDKARVGDWIVAIGNPFGLGGTVTAGIISARARDIRVGPYDDFLQTDASINRGNSGGPMFNLGGEVIGINTAIFSPSGGSIGIGFAVPANLAKPVIEQLRSFGRTRRGWLGVRIQAVTEEIAESVGLGKPRGALIASTSEGGPAEAAKIQAGDVILKFNGKDIDDTRTLVRVVADTDVGRVVDVVVWRNGKEIALKVKVGELEKAEAAGMLGTPADEGKEKTVAALGLKLAPISDEIRQRFDLKEGAKGVVVTEVIANGPAAEKNVKPGELIVEINQERVTTPAQVSDAIEKARKGGRQNVLILIEGQGGLRWVPVKIRDKG